MNGHSLDIDELTNGRVRHWSGCQKLNHVSLV